MTYEAASLPFQAPAAILVAPTTAHGFRFLAQETDGWVVSFTEDVADALGERSGAALARLKALAAAPVVPLTDEVAVRRLSALCADLHEEHFLAREGFRLAMRGLLALIAITVARLAASHARTGSVTLAPADATVEALRKLVEENFRKERHLDFYAEKLAMTADRLNDHVKRATGVTAGHLIRQRVLTEAKRSLVFTSQAIHEIAYDLAFSDPSHFARFFRKQTGTTPHEFRAGRGG
jgi:AraC family transcriptional activator of pobA